MAENEPNLPVRRPELVLRPLGDEGQHVVKDPRTGAYYTLGPEEAFLLERLDGAQSAEVICRAFEEHFGEPLPSDDLEEFLQVAHAQDFLVSEGPPLSPPPMVATSASTPAPVAIPPPAAKESVPAPTPNAPVPPPAAPPSVRVASAPPPAVSSTVRPLEGLSLLYWRRPLFDPDRLFAWLAPRLAFLWTRTFFWLSLGGIVAAGVVLGANVHELVNYLPSAVSWQSVVLAWVTLCLVMTCHEFAHGLTCKRHGGEVHELGFLLMFFIPCFYCNVSDAWLIRAKAKRLWVTLAGGYCDLCLWAAAAFVWRLTLPGTAVNHTAFVALSVCGLRVLLNFNPLLKLDGYYLLSDWLELPNLRQRSLNALRGWMRRGLWGAPRPEREPRGRFLLLFGLACWLFAAAYLGVLLVGLFRLAAPAWGIVGGVGIGLLGYLLCRGLFVGLAGGEVKQMVLKRRKRTFVWGVLLLGLAVLLVFGQMDEKASGPFRLTPVNRAEVRAPVSGFLKAVHIDEGGRVAVGAALALLEIPDLASRLAQKRSEVTEAKAKLRLLTAGPRPEELTLQRQRIARARGWRDLALQDLARRQKATEEQSARLKEQTAEFRTEARHAHWALSRAKRLLDKDALAPSLYREAEKQVQVAESRLQQAEAQARERRAVGALEAESELARREKDLAETEAALTLLEAGTRAEQLEAERARLARLEEEQQFLELQQGRLRLSSPVAGVVVTPRLRAKVGQYFREGDLICAVEDPSGLDVEITLQEQDVAPVKVGQEVELRVRALPFETFKARVVRISPGAAKPDKNDAQSSLTVTCRLEEASEGLRPGMTGHARISCGERAIGAMLGRSVLRFLRTEFWW